MSGGTLPNFIKFNNWAFDINPASANDEGNYSVAITITDGINSPVFYYNITVLPNEPPRFITPLQNQTFIVGFPNRYDFPPIYDKENVSVSVVSVKESSKPSLPSFLTLNGPTNLTFNLD